MWKYRESFSAPRCHFDLDKEVTAIFDDNETIGIGSKKAEESAVRVHVQHVPSTGAVDVNGCANVKRKLYLSDSVWAVIRTNVLMENAWLTNKPKEQTSVQFYHQRTMDQSSTLAVAYDHLSASHMQKNRREPLWTSVAGWLGFRPGHLEPHKLDVKLRWRPSTIPAFEHSLFFIRATSEYLKTNRDYGNVAASFVSRINRDLYIGAQIDVDINKKASSGRTLNGSNNSLPFDVAPRFRLGTMFAWEDQLMTFKINGTVTPKVTEEFSVRAYVDKTIEGMFFTPYAYVDYKHNAPQPTKAGIGMKINVGSD